MANEFDKQKYFIEEFNRLIVDDNMKEFILGSDNFKRSLKTTRNYLLYMNNCLTLAYLYVYGCYRQMTEYSEYPDDDFRDFIVDKDNNNTRVLNSLKKTYVQYPLTPELIQFVILDLQFDMLPGAPQNLNRAFGQFCDFSHSTMQGEYFNLVKYFNYIARWRLSPTRFDELENDQLIDLFLELITNMTFLQGHLCKMGNDYAFISARFYSQACARGAFVDGEFQPEILADMDVRPFVDCVPTRHTIIKGNDMTTFGFYYLSNIECKTNLNAIDLAYVHTQGVDNLFARVSESETEQNADHPVEHLPFDAPDYYYEITGTLWNQSEEKNAKKKEKTLIDQIHTINYKYIKNLALSVSDAISRTEGAKELLARAFSKNHPSLFANSDNMHDLDSIVIMLMIEESPTYLLNVLFSGDKQLFYDIVVNIDRRFDDKTLPFHNKSRKELAYEVDKLIKEKLLIGEHNSFKMDPRAERRQSEIQRLRPNAQAMLIISSLSKLVEEERQNEYIYAGNIFANIETLKGLKNNPDMATRIEYVQNILTDTFKHLICFYAGVFAYGDKKAQFDIETMNTCLPRNRIAVAQKELVDSFMEAAKKEAEQFKSNEKYENADIFVYIDDFIMLCNKCYQPGNFNERSYREKLYSAVGKYEILDLEAFNECLLSQLSGARTIDESNVNQWIDFALSMMEFFKTGSFSDTPIDHRLLDAVYPFTASYSKRNENRDGQITVTFSISIDIDADGVSDYKREINVLTEFSYNLQEVFYCLPNVQRSNERWWIDPLLISFTGFNAIFD